MDPRTVRDLEPGRTGSKVHADHAIGIEPRAHVVDIQFAIALGEGGGGNKELKPDEVYP